MLTALEYIHVDVFSPRPYSGNSLPVFPNAGGLGAVQMLRITQELRHFEAIFLDPTEERNRFKARVFDLLEELPFAGHPIVGAAAALHAASNNAGTQTWRFDLAHKSVSVTTDRTAEGYFGSLDQGRAEFFGEADEREVFARAFDLSLSDLDSSLPLAVVGAGLRYLIVPVVSDAMQRARIRNDIGPLLSSINAQFAVLLDETALEIRHWNNDGVIEDIATGSAAGTIGAYRLRYGRAASGEGFVLNQGRFAGRSSRLCVHAEMMRDGAISVKVGGDVALVGRGKLEALP